ncbi:MAG: FCD domain-containing protein, partial [Desulfuromonadaceae bacterium]|nr:FCD domain-containing protein [Desulfuromonadaceae bacterium]
TKFQRLRFTSLSLPGRMEVSVQEHEKIIDAFRNKDADLAETLVRQNAEYGGQVLISGAPPVKNS